MDKSSYVLKIFSTFFIKGCRNRVILEKMFWCHFRRKIGGFHLHLSILRREQRKIRGLALEVRKKAQKAQFRFQIRGFQANWYRLTNIGMEENAQKFCWKHNHLVEFSWHSEISIQGKRFATFLGKKCGKSSGKLPLFFMETAQYFCFAIIRSKKIKKAIISRSHKSIFFCIDTFRIFKTHFKHFQDSLEGRKIEIFALSSLAPVMYEQLFRNRQASLKPSGERKSAPLFSQHHFILQV